MKRSWSFRDLSGLNITYITSFLRSSTKLYYHEYVILSEVHGLLFCSVAEILSERFSRLHRWGIMDSYSVERALLHQSPYSYALLIARRSAGDISPTSPAQDDVTMSAWPECPGISYTPLTSCRSRVNYFSLADFVSLGVSVLRGRDLFWKLPGGILNLDSFRATPNQVMMEFVDVSRHVPPVPSALPPIPNFLVKSGGVKFFKLRKFQVP